MRELGVLGNPAFNICAMVDHAAMITVGPLGDYGVFDCKPLGYLWAHSPLPGGWHAGNTIMFDDLRRNFVMNPQCGLRIRAFRNAHTARHTDDELARLTTYLLDIAALEDFRRAARGRCDGCAACCALTTACVARRVCSGLNHRKWESYRPPR